MSRNGSGAVFVVMFAAQADKVTIASNETPKRADLRECLMIIPVSPVTL